MRRRRLLTWRGSRSIAAVEEGIEVEWFGMDRCCLVLDERGTFDRVWGQAVCLLGMDVGCDGNWETAAIEETRRGDVDNQTRRAYG